MHENARELHSTQSVGAHVRAKRPLSTGDRDMNIGRASGRSRSKSIHARPETVIASDPMPQSLISNAFNSSDNNPINGHMSGSNFNYLYHDFSNRNNDPNIDPLIPNSGIDYFNSNNNQFSYGEYPTTNSNNSCPPFSFPNPKHTFVKNNFNNKSSINTTITSTNDYEPKPNRSSSCVKNSCLDIENSCKHDITNNNCHNKHISYASDEQLRSNQIAINSNCSVKSTGILKQLLKSKVNTTQASNCSENGANSSCHSIPTNAEKAQFRRSLDSASKLVFHGRNGFPLTSSPAPMRKSGTCFDFDSSLTSVNAIKKALFEKDPDVDIEIEQQKSLKYSTSAPASTTISSLLGNFEESVLNGRLEPASIVHGFSAEIGASGSFCPRHKTLPVTVFFYTLQDTDKADKVSSPYLGHINLGKKGYHIPRKGTVQATLFNPHGTVVKMFVVRYDLSDMPPNSQTFLRQRTLFMPSDGHENDPDNRKWLRYLIHLRVVSSKSGRIYLHTDVRIIVFRKHDLDVATINGHTPYELRSFTQCPVNPKYS